MPGQKECAAWVRAAWLHASSRSRREARQRRREKKKGERRRAGPAVRLSAMACCAT